MSAGKNTRDGMTKRVVDEICKALPYIQRSGARHIAFDLDEEADKLYISFEKPQNATDTEGPNFH